MSAQALPAHVRTIAVEATGTRGADGRALLRVQGTLVDRRPAGIPPGLSHEGDVIHHMEVTLVVAHPDLTVVEVEARMHVIPFATICPDALPALQSLVGLSVVRGFTRAVNQRLGREKGCTHVVALILAMAPVVRQGAGAAYGFAQPAPDDAGDGQSWVVNSCQAWREGGPLHSRMMERRAGRIASGVEASRGD